MHPSDDPDDAARLDRYAGALADGIERALPVWVRRCVVERADAWRPGLGEVVEAAAEEAGARAVEAVVADLRALLATDVDDQRTGPLALVRGAVVHPTRILAEAGVPEVERDADAEALHPDDVYDLTPGSFADLDPDLAEPGMLWGAAKAHVVLARRRAEGKR